MGFYGEYAASATKIRSSPLSLYPSLSLSP
jgi:hypothetical protein